MSVRSREKNKKKIHYGSISFFVVLFLVCLGAIQLVSTFYSYAVSLSDLNQLRRQEASLVAQKKDLEHRIARWNDESYITAQARERLGFVFPGEQSVRVLHPEAVSGQEEEKQKTTDKTTVSQLPWYEELVYDFSRADQIDRNTGTLSSQQQGDANSSSETNKNNGTNSETKSESAENTQDAENQSNGQN